MRLIHLTAGNLYGGIETYLVTLARCRHLTPQVEPHFGLCFPGRVQEELTSAGVPVHNFGQVRVSRPWTVLRARRRLVDLLGKMRFTVAVAHGSWPHAVFAPVVRRMGVQLAHAVHGDLSRPNRLDLWAARTQPNVVLANSRFTAVPAAKLFPLSRVEVAYLPVPRPDIGDPATVRREVRATLGTSPEAVVILQASRFEPCKGQAVHLEALSQLAELPAWEAWFVGGVQNAGEAELQAKLAARVEQSGVAGRVRFLGQRADVRRIMAAADIYCQPNTGPEGFGLTFVEAFHAGLPVVTSDFGGAAEVVDPTCGVLVSPGNPAAVAEALRGLIRDPVRRRALGSCGPARAAELCDPTRQLRLLAAAATGQGGYE